MYTAVYNERNRATTITAATTHVSFMIVTDSDLEIKEDRQGVSDGNNNLKPRYGVKKQRYINGGLSIWAWCYRCTQKSITCMYGQTLEVAVIDQLCAPFLNATPLPATNTFNPAGATPT